MSPFRFTPETLDAKLGLSPLDPRLVALVNQAMEDAEAYPIRIYVGLFSFPAIWDVVTALRKAGFWVKYNCSKADEEFMIIQRTSE